MIPLLAATQTSTGEAVAFWVLAPIAVLAAVMIVLSRKAVHSALWMATTMIILAVFFIMQGGIFLGVVQVVVYTGAVMMLFLFVLMLVGVDASDSFVETLRAQRVAAILLAAGVGSLLVAGVSRSTFPEAPGVGPANDASGGHVEAIAEAIFTRYVFTFEVVSIVLITAAVGAMALTHKERLTARKPQRVLAVERVRSSHPTPYPHSTTRSTPRRCCPTALPPRRRCPKSCVAKAPSATPRSTQRASRARTGVMSDEPRELPLPGIDPLLDRRGRSPRSS
jgi:NADH-quinone oxidoreductase subunit J